MAEQKRESIVRWAQVGATLFLGVVGLVFTYVTNRQQEENRNNQMEQQEKNRKNQLGIEIMSKREQSEIDFRQKMFGVLVTELLDSRVDVRDRLTRLQLFQHNFHDVFNARALFDVLDREARTKEDGDTLIHDLVSLAKEVTEKQELLIGAKSTFVEIEKGDSTIVHLNFKEKKYQHEEADEGTNAGEHVIHGISIKLMKVEKHNVRVKVKVIFDVEKPDSVLLKREFNVSYYDAPLTDNTLLPDKHRFAITLKETNMKTQEATLNVFEFPADFVTTGYRPMITEANKLIEGVQ